MACWKEKENKEGVAEESNCQVSSIGLRLFFAAHAPEALLKHAVWHLRGIPSFLHSFLQFICTDCYLKEESKQQVPCVLTDVVAYLLYRPLR